jgi:hypothetical protein
VTHVIFGDIIFDEHRRWAERMCEGAGLTAVEPLFGLSTLTLFEEWTGSGADAVIVTARAEFLDESWLGRPLRREMLDAFTRLGVDPCGERGEYHTVVTNTPLFNRPLCSRPARVQRSGCWALDVMSTMLRRVHRSVGPAALAPSRYLVRLSARAPAATSSMASSLQCARGSIVGLLGPNGSGKTTLLRSRRCAERQSGRCAIDGPAVEQLTRRDLARRIAVVPQETHSTFDFTVMDMVLMGRIRTWARSSSRARRTRRSRAMRWQPPARPHSRRGHLRP